MTNMRLVWVQHWSYLPVVVEDIDPGNGQQDRVNTTAGQRSTDHKNPRGRSGRACKCFQRLGFSQSFLFHFSPPQLMTGLLYSKITVWQRPIRSPVGRLLATTPSCRWPCTQHVWTKSKCAGSGQSATFQLLRPVRYG